MVDTPPNGERRNPSSDLQIYNAAKLASKEAVVETFRLIGVDINDQDSVNKFHSNMNYLQHLRDREEARHIETKKAIITSIASVAAGCVMAVMGYLFGTHTGGKGP
jgi:hypothetical protein